MTMQISALRHQRPVQPIPVPMTLQPTACPAVLPAARPAAAVGDDVFALAAETQTLERDEVLFYEGDDARSVYRIVEGMVRTSILLPDGRRYVVDFLQAGDIVGLTASDTHTYTAEAVTPVTLSRMSRRKLDDAVAVRPGLGRKMLATIQSDLVAAHERLLLLGRKSVTERLASFLLILRDRQPADKAPTRVVHLPMGRTDIADYLGLTIETVSRTFTKLKTAGVIRLIDTYEVAILDPDQLAVIAAGK